MDYSSINTGGKILLGGGIVASAGMYYLTNDSGYTLLPLLFTVPLSAGISFLETIIQTSRLNESNESKLTELE